MKAITEASQVERYRHLLTEMMRGDDLCEFDPDWIRRRSWKVVPAESMARLPQPDIPRLVSVLRNSGSSECIALTTEPVGDLPTCYAVRVDEADFAEVNRELGPFRFLLTDEGLSWAISCTEWYNLFAAEPDLLEAILGKPVQQARDEFVQFASGLADADADEQLLKVAARYAAL
ncbi:MAG: hypothetical protein ACUVS7_19920 [Bryobacteraceae bacterium]